jgi:hypothetical protein
MTTRKGIDTASAGAEPAEPTNPAARATGQPIGPAGPAAGPNQRDGAPTAEAGLDDLVDELEAALGAMLKRSTLTPDSSAPPATASGSPGTNRRRRQDEVASKEPPQLSGSGCEETRGPYIVARRSDPSADGDPISPPMERPEPSASAAFHPSQLRPSAALPKSEFHAAGSPHAAPEPLWDEPEGERQEPFPAQLAAAGASLRPAKSPVGAIDDTAPTDHLSAFWDILPTLSDIAGIAPPEDIDGISFLPVLKGNEQEQEQHEYLYWEFPAYGGQQAVRMGKWKGLRKDIISDGNLEIELYNLEEDIQEQHNLADQYPDIVSRMERIMEREHTVPVLDEFKMQALTRISGN